MLSSLFRVDIALCSTGLRLDCGGRLCDSTLVIIDRAVLAVEGSIFFKPDSTVAISKGTAIDLGLGAKFKPLESTFCSGGESVRDERLMTQDGFRGLSGVELEV